MCARDSGKLCQGHHCADQRVHVSHKVRCALAFCTSSELLLTQGDFFWPLCLPVHSQGLERNEKRVSTLASFYLSCGVKCSLSWPLRFFPTCPSPVYLSCDLLTVRHNAHNTAIGGRWRTACTGPVSLCTTAAWRRHSGSHRKRSRPPQSPTIRCCWCVFFVRKRAYALFVGESSEAQENCDFDCSRTLLLAMSGLSTCDGFWQCTERIRA